MSEKVYVGSKMATFRDYGAYEPISRVTYWYDDEHYYTAGDDTGRELVANCRSATQAMVDKIYARLKGFVYRPFEATGVDIDPAVEPGDAVTIGGIYSFIGRLDINYDAMCNINIGAPGEREVGHETPWVDPVQRELKRRVKLGQKYQGVKIDRQDGLTITETDGETEGAKVVLNSKELSFYDVGGGKVLYFDTSSGTYKFMGELNVNDKFVVDKKGDVRISGNLLLSEESTITWGTKGPVKYKFAPAMSGPWHDTMEANDKYRRDSLDGGTTWGDPYQFKGTDGAAGSDADVPGYIKKTHIDATGIETFHIKANKVEAVCPAGSQTDTEIGFILTGAYGDSSLRYMRIYSFNTIDSPYVVFESPQHCPVLWSFNNTIFSGRYEFTRGAQIDFGNADVTGITATFA